MIKNRNISITSRPLSNKLRIVFLLMSALPILVSLYLISNYIVPRFGLQTDIIISILTSMFISLAGFFLLREIFSRVASVCAKAKSIASGELNHKLDIIEREDEIGDLSDALNQINSRISNNMTELKNYSQRTAEINMEINKRVFVLSNLLQISSLISQGEELEKIFKLTLEKCRLSFNSEITYLMMREEARGVFVMKAVDGADSDHLYQLMNAEIDLHDKVFVKFADSVQPLILDRENMLSPAFKKIFSERFKLNSTLALPVFLRGRIIGLLGIGSKATDILYKKDDIDIMEVFSKQIAIAVENDILTRRVDKLEVKDALTGLYNEAFIRSRLQEEIKRAIIYQRPCAFIVLELNKFDEFYKKFGSLQAESSLKKTAALIAESVSEVDRVARIDNHAFAIVLPEKNKRQAKGIADDIRKKIETSFGRGSDADKALEIDIGVSENPLDGVEANELISRAKEFIISTRA